MCTCFICKNNHTINNDILCLTMFNMIINNYKNIDIKKIPFEKFKINEGNFPCPKCKKELSSRKNLNVKNVIAFLHN